MKTVYWYQVEVFEIPYTKQFKGMLEMKSSVHGLEAEVILIDNESDFEKTIAGCISKEYDIEDCHRYVCEILENKSYCLGVWSKYKN